MVSPSFKAKADTAQNKQAKKIFFDISPPNFTQIPPWTYSKYIINRLGKNITKAFSGNFTFSVTQFYSKGKN